MSNTTKTVTYEAPAGVEFDIERPDGSRETARHPKFKSITEAMFKQIQDFNAKQGKGRVVGYRNLTETRTRTIAMDEADWLVEEGYKIRDAMNISK